MRDYVVATALGMLPGTILYVYLGSLVATRRRGLGEPAAGGWCSLGRRCGAPSTPWCRRRDRDAPVVHSGASSVRIADEPPSHGLVADDAHDRALVAHVHPADWHEPDARRRYNLVVIGGGTGGPGLRGRRRRRSARGSR